MKEKLWNSLKLLSIADQKKRLTKKKRRTPLQWSKISKAKAAVPRIPPAF
jgi:hypothetical protein